MYMSETFPEPVLCPVHQLKVAMQSYILKEAQIQLGIS